MNKTKNFFVIHNFNTVPTDLIELCEGYVIYDCSSDEAVKQQLRSMNLNLVEVENTGHNITSYFTYFVQNYENLPEVMCLLKGNMIGRHCSREFFEQVYDNQSFTFLYDEKQYWDRFSKYDSNNQRNEAGTTFLAMENVYVEKNDSWYVESPNHPKRYFNDADDLLRFIYKKPMIPQYFMFSPGACFIVRREQVLRHGMNPSFPSEAHQIERILPILFTSFGEVNEWMDDEKAFEEKLPECSAYIRYKWENRPRRFKKIRQLLGLI